MTNPRVLKSEPPVVPLDVMGAFIRVGEQTFVRYDQIVGMRTVEAIIWSPPEGVEPEESPESDEPPGDAPRIAMTQLYLEGSPLSGLRIDTADGGFTTTPVVRHSLLEMGQAIEEASANKAAAEAKIMSGMIARAIEDDTGAEVTERV